MRNRGERSSTVLWQYDWHQPAPSGLPDEDFGYDRSFRIVGWSWPEDEGRIGQIHYEELTKDALGSPTWVNAEDEVGICRPVIIRLLKLAGIIPDDADTGDLE